MNRQGSNGSKPFRSSMFLASWRFTNRSRRAPRIRRIPNAIAPAHIGRPGRTPTPVIGTHFAAQTAGWIVRDRAAYRLEV
jgi:hypothetical protein